MTRLFMIVNGEELAVAVVKSESKEEALKKFFALFDEDELYQGSVEARRLVFSKKGVALV